MIEKTKHLKVTILSLLFIVLSIVLNGQVKEINSGEFDDHFANQNWVHRTSFKSGKNVLDYNQITGLINIKVSRNPLQVSISPDSRYAFILCGHGNAIDVIDLAEYKLVKSISVASPISMTITNDGSKLVVISSSEIPRETSVYTKDCLLIIVEEGRSMITTIDIPKLTIDKQQIYQVPAKFEKILNSKKNDIFYIQAYNKLFEIDLPQFSITKEWGFDQSINNGEIDLKNEKIFLTFYDTLRAITLSNGQISSRPIPPFGGKYIAVDTLKNRIFIDGNINGITTDFNFLAIDANSLATISTIPGRFALSGTIFLPKLNMIYACGFWGSALELDYTTLKIKRTLKTNTNWKSMVYNPVNKMIYTFGNGPTSGCTVIQHPPLYLDFIEFNPTTNTQSQSNTTAFSYDNFAFRSITMSPNYSKVIITNSPENTISILNTGVISGIPQFSDIDSDKLYQNYPNPFTNSTTIKYSVSDFSHAKLSIFNSVGQLVAILVDESKGPGEYSISLNNKVFNLPKGTYFYRLQTDKIGISKKLIIAE